MQATETPAAISGLKGNSLPLTDVEGLGKQATLICPQTPEEKQLSGSVAAEICN